MTYRVEASAEVHAPADRVYAILADFREHHPKITPPKYFGPVTIEQGGMGAGTIIRFPMTVLGRKVDCRSIITEPAPGRVLVETETNTKTVTTFTVDRGPDGSSQVTIASQFTGRDGIMGAIERWIGRRVIRGIYAQELQLLDSYAAAGFPRQP